MSVKFSDKIEAAFAPHESVVGHEKCTVLRKSLSNLLDRQDVSQERIISDLNALTESARRLSGQPSIVDQAGGIVNGNQKIRLRSLFGLRQN